MLMVYQFTGPDVSGPRILYISLLKPLHDDSCRRSVNDVKVIYDRPIKIILSIFSPDIISTGVRKSE
jgi:hypothetical protein